VARLIPGVLGKTSSVAEESFNEALLEYPQYTRPQRYQGLSVPSVLLSGDSRAIAVWRQLAAWRRTRQRRPDLAHAFLGGSHGW